MIKLPPPASPGGRAASLCPVLTNIKLSGRRWWSTLSSAYCSLFNLQLAWYVGLNINSELLTAEKKL
jgi:hypothetical protein